LARIVGIDYGKRRSGIAMTDILQISINPVSIIDTKNLFLHIKEILEAKETEVLVVGWPLHADGNETDLCASIQKFINKCKYQFPKLSIVKVEEEFTSREASEIIHLSGKSKKFKKQKQNLDSLSAVLIIKRYIDSNPSL
jgi:putative Holliday junction resolvase